MKERTVSAVYGQALYELGQEKQIDIISELKKFKEAIDKTPELNKLLFFEIFTHKEKLIVTNAILKHWGHSKLTRVILNFLIQEKRMEFFPSIIEELTILQDRGRGILRGTLEGPLEGPPPLDEREAIEGHLRDKEGMEPQLDYVQNRKITAGYRVIVEDILLDISLDHQLNLLREYVLNFQELQREEV